MRVFVIFSVALPLLGHLIAEQNRKDRKVFSPSDILGVTTLTAWLSILLEFIIRFFVWLGSQ